MAREGSHGVVGETLSEATRRDARARGDRADPRGMTPTAILRARERETGGRRLEELAFEVVSTERLGRAIKKARALAERGVRRVFAVDVKKKRALEYSRRTGTWEMLSPDGVIEDPALVAALPIE